jgi:uncharacterized protein
VIEVVELAGVTPQPWKNGGGITRDLLAWPQAADWQLRISVADVAQSGPFSAYPGITRWFAVVQGEGVVLRFGERVHTLAPGSQPLRFDGGDAPGCDLIRGPTLDLNLLAASKAGRADMRPVLPGVPWLADAALRAVFTARPAELVVAGQPLTALPALSLAFSWQGAGQSWQLRSDGAAPRAWWLAFTAHAP